MQVALGDHASEVVARWAELSGASRSAVIREVVEGSLPVLEHMIAAAEAYQAMDAAKQAEIRAALEAAEPRVLGSALKAADEFTDFMDGIAGKK